MVYHACYEVNYKSNSYEAKIIILRYKCKICKVSHSIKPEFLASRHQYDTFERQIYVQMYTFDCQTTLRGLQDYLFPLLDVSHTVMYYWVRIVEIKKIEAERLILEDLQTILPHEDMSGDLLKEASQIPENTRAKAYSEKTAILFNWAGIYIRIIERNPAFSTIGIIQSPYLYLNRILDNLRAFEFL